MEGEHFRLASWWSAAAAAAVQAVLVALASLDGVEWRLVALMALSLVGVYLLARATSVAGAWAGAALLATPIFAMGQQAFASPAGLLAAAAILVTWGLLAASSWPQPVAQPSSDGLA